MGAETPNASHDNCNDCVAFDACFIKNITVNDRFFAIQSRMEENGGDIDEAENFVNLLFPTQQEIQSAINDHEQQDQNNLAQPQDSLTQSTTPTENSNQPPETNMQEAPAPTIEINDIDPSTQNLDSGSFWFQPPASGLDRSEPQTPGGHGTQNGTESGNDHGQDYGQDQMSADQQQGEQPPGSEYQTVFNPETGLNEIVFDRVTPDQKKQIETLNTAFIDTMSADYQASASFSSAEGKLFVNPEGKLDIFDPATGKGILEGYVEYPGGVTKAEFESAIQSIFKDGQAVIDHYVDGVAKYRTIYILDSNHNVKTIYLELPGQEGSTDTGDVEPDARAGNAAASPENTPAIQETEDSDADDSVDNVFMAAKATAKEAKSSGADFFNRLKNEGAISKVVDLKKFTAEKRLEIAPKDHPAIHQPVEPQANTVRIDGANSASDADLNRDFIKDTAPILIPTLNRTEQIIDQQTYFETVMATGGITLEGVSPVLAREQAPNAEMQNLSENQNLNQLKPERPQQETADPEKTDVKNSVDKDADQNIISANSSTVRSSGIKGKSPAGTNSSNVTRSAAKTAKPIAKVFGIKQLGFDENNIGGPNLTTPDRGPKDNGGPRLQKDSFSGESTIAQSFVQLDTAAKPAEVRKPAEQAETQTTKIEASKIADLPEEIKAPAQNVDIKNNPDATALTQEVEADRTETSKEAEVIPDIVQEVADILDTKEMDDAKEQMVQPIDSLAEVIQPEQTVIQETEPKTSRPALAEKPLEANRAVVRDAIRRPAATEKFIKDSTPAQQFVAQQITQRQATFRKEQFQAQAEAVKQVQEALKALAEWRETASSTERGENTTPAQSARVNSASQQQDDNERAPLNPAAQAEELALAA